MEIALGAGSLATAKEVQERGTEASAFLFHAIEKPTGPGEIYSEQTKSKKNHQPAGPRADQEDDSERQKSKACSDAEHPESLLKRFKDKQRHGVTL